ncbi:hypothetical protein IFO70_13025 [Phormidium tenue FACHB-886]|nr:hypothetical protein [Phormidium tenue FACHB-886]
MTVSSPPNTTHRLRPELGDFSSIACFKAVVVGIEEALGEKAATIALIAAGRARGKQLAAQLEYDNGSLEELTGLLNHALGTLGTRLCLIDRIAQDGEVIRVHCRETICSSGEPQGSSRCLTYTLGAIQGVLEQVVGKRLRGKQVESILRGSNQDVLEFQTI